jgi:hypothetical protein
MQKHMGNQLPRSKQATLPGMKGKNVLDIYHGILPTKGEFCHEEKPINNE